MIRSSSILEKMRPFCVLFALFISIGVARSRSVTKRDVSPAFKVCVEVLLLDCDRTYRPDVDETACATNGRTYSNLCHYSQARCAKHDLQIVYFGHCGRTTPRATTPRPTTPRPTSTPQPTTPQRLETQTAQPTTTAILLTTPERITRPSPTPWVTSVTATERTSTVPPSTTEIPTTDVTPTPRYTVTGTVPPVTIDPALDIVKQVFCMQAIHIICNSELDPLCGTDGNFYLNRCTFAKAECTNAKLEPVNDLSFCTNH